MAARTPKAPNRPTRTGGAKKPTPAPTRAQLKAMEARAASAARATAFARGEDVDDTPDGGRTATRGTRTTRAASRSGVRAGAERTIGSLPMPEFSVRTEMAYHRRDLIRLLIVAAILIVIYVVLWFFLH
ncbi:MAG: hypothetical protein ACYDAR_04625 [Thermomicrobiales bacterium]